MSMQKTTRFLNTLLFGAGLVIATGVCAHELPLYVFEKPAPAVEPEMAVTPVVDVEPETVTVPVKRAEASATPHTIAADAFNPTPFLNTKQMAVSVPAAAEPVAPAPVMQQLVQPAAYMMPVAVPVEIQPVSVTAPVMPMGQPVQWVSMAPAQPAPMMSAQAASMTGVDLIDIEMPFRCTTNAGMQRELSTTLSLKDGDFELVPVLKSDDLPRFEVNGYTFRQKPADEALQTLVAEAGIAVYAEDAVYPSLSASNVYGELAAVTDELTGAADTFYRYDADKKELLLMRKADFAVTLPQNRLVLLGVLDALRGAGIEAIVPDWGNNRLMLTLTRAEQEKVSEILKKITTDGHLLLADVHVYQSGAADWNVLLRQFGLQRVLSVTDSLNGKLLTLKQKDVQPFLSVLRTGMALTPVSSGNLVVPNGWKMRFDIGKCNPFVGAALSLSIQQTLHTIDTVDTQITVNSNNQEVGTFKTVTALDNELAIVGLQDGVTGGEWLITFDLKMIRLVKEK